MKLCEVARFTGNVDRLTAFYRSFLGFEPEVEGDGMAIFNVNGIKHLIHETYPDRADWPKGVDHIAYGVANLDNACQEVRDRGLEVDGPKDFDWGRSAYIEDPDGRMVELYQADG